MRYSQRSLSAAKEQAYELQEYFEDCLEETRKLGKLIGYREIQFKDIERKIMENKNKNEIEEREILTSTGRRPQEQLSKQVFQSDLIKDLIKALKEDNG